VTSEKEKCRINLVGLQEVRRKVLKRLHNKDLHSLYRSSNIVRLIKSRRLRWTDNVARMEEVRSAFNSLADTLTGNRP